MGELMTWAMALGHILALIVILFCIEAATGHGLDTTTLALAIGIGALSRTYRKTAA